MIKDKFPQKKQIDIIGKVIYASSQTTNGKASNIKFWGNDVRKPKIWFSDSRGKFPQELGILLEQTSSISALQLTCPVHFCPSKVEVYSAVCSGLEGRSQTSDLFIQGPEEIWRKYREAVFTKIGEICIEMPRELLQATALQTHSILLDSPEVKFVSILLHEPIPNLKNHQHQVALSSVKILGRPLPQVTHRNQAETHREEVIDVLKELGLSTDFFQPLSLRSDKLNEPNLFSQQQLARQVIVGSEQPDFAVNPYKCGQTVYSHSWNTVEDVGLFDELDIGYLHGEGWGTDKALFYGPSLFLKKRKGAGIPISSKNSNTFIERKMWEQLGYFNLKGKGYPELVIAPTLQFLEANIDEIIGWDTIHILVQNPEPHIRKSVLDVIRENFAEVVGNFVQNYTEDSNQLLDLQNATAIFQSLCLVIAQGLADCSEDVLSAALQLLCRLFSGDETDGLLTKVLAYLLPGKVVSWGLDLLLPFVARRLIKPARNTDSTCTTPFKGAGQRLVYSKKSSTVVPESQKTHSQLDASSCLVFLSSQRSVGPTRMASVVGKVTLADLQPLRWVLFAGKVMCLALLVNKRGLIPDSFLDINDVMHVATSAMNHQHEQVKDAALELIVQVYYKVGKEAALKHTTNCNPRDIVRIKARLAFQVTHTCNKSSNLKTPVLINTSFPPVTNTGHKERSNLKTPGLINASFPLAIDNSLEMDAPSNPYVPHTQYVSENRDREAILSSEDQPETNITSTGTNDDFAQNATTAILLEKTIDGSNNSNANSANTVLQSSLKKVNNDESIQAVSLSTLREVQLYSDLSDTSVYNLEVDTENEHDQPELDSVKNTSIEQSVLEQSSRSTELNLQLVDSVIKMEPFEINTQKNTTTNSKIDQESVHNFSGDENSTVFMNSTVLMHEKSTNIVDHKLSQIDKNLTKSTGEPDQQLSKTQRDQQLSKTQQQPSTRTKGCIIL